MTWRRRRRRRWRRRIATTRDALGYAGHLKKLILLYKKASDSEKTYLERSDLLLYGHSPKSTAVLVSFGNEAVQNRIFWKALLFYVMKFICLIK